MITLFTSMAIGIVLASVLTLVSSRYKLTVRSLGWNAALAVSEAGLEEALSHLHTDSNNPTANGWSATTIGGQPVHTKTRFLPDGSYYYVTIYNASSASPVIYSSGFMPSPLETNQYISRMVRLDSTNATTVFIRALASSGAINLNGGAVVDSFNSHLGPYDVTTNRNATGNIATSSTAEVDVGNAHIYGTVTTAPGGSVTLGGNGAIGDEAWNAAHTGIEPGWTNNNMNEAFPANVPPVGGPFPSPPVTSAGGSNITYLNTGNYQSANFSVSHQKDPLIVLGTVTLYVPGDFSISGNGYIYIAPGASLTLYVGGSAKLSGGGVVNASGTAANFSFIGLPGNTEITYNGHVAFVGTINAPQARFTLNGGAQFYGAAIVGPVEINGGASLHYDEALATGAGASAAAGPLLLKWTEL